MNKNIELLSEMTHCLYYPVRNTGQMMKICLDHKYEF